MKTLALALALGHQLTPGALIAEIAERQGSIERDLRAGRRLSGLRQRALTARLAGLDQQPQRAVLTDIQDVELLLARIEREALPARRVALGIHQRQVAARQQREAGFALLVDDLRGQRGGVERFGGDDLARREAAALLERGDELLVHLGRLSGLTKAAALAYVRDGVRINAVCPGSTRTPLLEGFMSQSPEIEKAISQSAPIGRLAHPDEIAAAIERRRAACRRGAQRSRGGGGAGHPTRRRRSRKRDRARRPRNQEERKRRRGT